MEDSPLSVRKLGKTFPRRLGLSSFRAVDSVDIQMSSGEILGFLGPNGAGKTTTIKCVLGLLRPSSGSISLWGEPPGSRGARRRIGFVPENPDYEDIFTPLELLSMFASMRGLDQDDRKERVLLSRVGLSGWERTRLRSFSKGMRQRVSLALALQSGPDLLVLDEPTGGLDPAARKEFRDIILEENRRGASVFLSSHLLSEVETVCHRAVILAKGRKVSEGTMEELLRTEDTYSVRYAAAEEGPEDVTEVRVPGDLLQSTIDEIRGRGLPIVSVAPVYRSLEEVFLTATGEEGPE
ncbi:MAG: hypothetical protein AVO35_04150 [Candidatus Aegiribacteria sp. MLS_C]|nr:MAG: hypothetical protein AVO35_04150 [Candidatus Aegiribacteria sp. MLS_C]